MMNNNFSEETQEYINAVEAYLTSTYGNIKDSWKPLIQMLATEYDLYLATQEAIKSNGILIQTKNGMASNPAVKISHDSLIQIQKLVQELGISPKIEIKLKTSNLQNEQEDDFLANLTK